MTLQFPSVSRIMLVAPYLWVWNVYMRNVGRRGIRYTYIHVDNIRMVVEAVPIDNPLENKRFHEQLFSHPVPQARWQVYHLKIVITQSPP